MEFSNEKFKNIYYKIIDILNQNPDFKLDSLINVIDQDMAHEVTSILWMTSAIVYLTGNEKISFQRQKKKL